MTRKLLSVCDFKLAAEGGDGPEPGSVVIRLAMGEPAAVDGAARTMRFVFSDDTVDRAGDVISGDGWVLDDFLKNPVALWAHDSYSPPIGRASNLVAAGGKLKGDIEFMPADVNAFADSVFRMVEGGWIKAVSVGFRPLEYKFVDSEGRPFGIDFLKQELMEISVCPVPCNPAALIEARSKGIDTEPLREWAERLLDSGESVIVPRALLEETFVLAKTPHTVRRLYLARPGVAPPEEKAGRRIGRDNADRLNKAADHVGQAMEHIKAVLDSNEPEEDPPADPPVDDDPPFEFAAQRESAKKLLEELQAKEKGDLTR